MNSFILKEPAWIPHSHHRAKFLGIASDAVCDLECNVDIIGAKQPHNKLTIDISPEGKDVCWSLPTYEELLSKIDHLPSKVSIARSFEAPTC